MERVPGHVGYPVIDGHRTCTRCGKTKPIDQFKPRRDRPNPSSHCRACSNATAMAAQVKTRRPAVPRAMGPCAWCGAETIGTGPTRRYCTKRCRYLADYERNYKAKRPLRTYACVECGTSFTTTWGDKRRTFCSQRCSARAARRTAKHNRRGYGNGDGGITTWKLGQRDGWCCHICGEQTKREHGGGYDPRGPTIDHLVPVSAGGSHTWDNVALAHHECNSLRGAAEPGGPSKV